MNYGDSPGSRRGIQRHEIGLSPAASCPFTGPELRRLNDVPDMYSKIVVLNHTENEFVLDFAFIEPRDGRATVRFRMISSPRHTKRFLQAPEKNLDRYEERFEDRRAVAHRAQ